jgi:CDP-diacylglycerol---glycerol-3-phosphate 3-phosphatidyltransferase
MRFQPSAWRAQVTRWITRPLDVLVRRRVSPNLITTLGVALNLGAALAFFLGALQWGGLLVLLGGFVDIVDGHVARATGLASTFGSFYDSTTDRIAEIAVLLGVMSLYLGNDPNIGEPWMVYVVVLALAGSLMVSYTRARAEGLGIDCKVGLMQRAERIILLGGSTLFFGSWRAGLVLTIVMFLMALLTTSPSLSRRCCVCPPPRALEEPAQPAPPRRAHEPATR